jgi:hypothetical protein
MARWVWWWAAALAVGTAASRLPFRGRYLFSWDSANFALALDHYNVAFHQPQPPGYPLYVASAWLVRHIAGEANAGYVWLSIAASALAVLFLTLAAARLYDGLSAVLAGILLASSSVFWSQGEVAYPYAFLSGFGALVAWLCAEVPHLGPVAGPRLVALCGLLIGIGGGFRSELIPFLVPLWLYASLRRPDALRVRLASVAAGSAVMALAIAAWYAPMVQRSGGLAAYQAATAAYYGYFVQTTSGAGKLLLGLLENTRALVGFLYNGLGLALLPAVYFAGRFFSPQHLVADARARFLLLWLLPPLLFYVTVHIGNPGYVLSLVPALCIYIAQAVLGFLEDVRAASETLAASRGVRAGAAARLAARAWVAPAATACVVAIGLTNAALFRFGNGEGRYPEIRQIDRIFERQLATIREQYPPSSTIILAYDRSRQYRYYLPRHRIELLFDVPVAGAVTDTSRYWERRATLMIPAGVTAVLFPDLERNTSDLPGLVQRLDLGAGVDLFVARVQPGDEVRYGYHYAAAQRR